MAILEAVFANKAGQTPQEVDRRRRMAQALIEAGAGGKPPSSGLELAGRLAMTLTGQYQAGKAERQDAANRAAASSLLTNALLGDGSAPSGQNNAIPAPGAANEMSGTAPGNSSYRDAIASIESDGSGGYSAVGPTHPKMGRALGRYQIMESNIGPWSQEALGRAVTPDEFLADPKLQDAIFDKKFGSYVSQYGPEGAAQAWFAGPGGVGKLDRRDSLGTSVADYTQKFSRALGGGQEVASLDPSVGMASRAPTQGPTLPAPELPPPTTVANQPPVASVPQQSSIIGSQVPGQPPQMVAQAQPNRRAQIAALLQNPYTQEIGQQMLMQEYQRQQDESDPLRQLQLQEAQIKIDQARNPPADYDYVKMEDGTIVRTSKRGGTPEVVFQGQPKPQAKPSAVQEYEYAREQGFPGTFQDWEASKKGGMSLQVDPNTGAVTFQQGGNIKPMTEGQSKDAVYSTRAQGALEKLNANADALLSFPETMASGLPIGGNYLLSPEYQQAQQAGKEFLQAILRKDTGAAITKEETEEYGSVYLPRPGDTKEVLEQKKVSRQRALEAIKAGMPPQAILAQEKALKATGDTAPVETPTSPLIDDLLKKYGTPQ
ncbi:hypothetical protein [Rhizobium lentis]|uniref:Phage tail lysozyme domain-containing protein n=1 Tax=Rhizobium lentis TaxID=1138194 RepID=A0ABS7IDZ3_9HYPH|nr:hypothetical protein [Rhizobium lentis]MBX5089345.1 hypothetical protein [Rhizobium lentis]